MARLKPCPFCGGEAEIYYSSFNKGFFWRHKDRHANCIMITPALMADRSLDSLADAYAAWNRRKESGEEKQSV